MKQISKYDESRRYPLKGTLPVKDRIIEKPAAAVHVRPVGAHPLKNLVIEKYECDKPLPSNAFIRFFTPRYNGSALFMMSLSSVLVFLSDASLRTSIYDAFLFWKPFGILHFVVHGLELCLSAGFLIMGIILSIVHGFTNRQMSDLAKIFMLYFAIMMSGSSGIAAGQYMLKNSPSILIVFPVWNIINGGLLFFLYRLRLIDQRNVTDDEVIPSQLVVGSIILIIVFCVCRFICGMFWATTFSICVAYATNASDTVQNLFFRSREEIE